MKSINGMKSVLCRLIGSAAIAWFLAGGVLMALEIRNDSEAVDLMGKQRMFSLRILKDYTMMGLKLNFGDPQGDLKKTMEAFEEAHKALMGYVKDPKIRQKLEELDRTWKETKKILQQPPEHSKGQAYLKMMFRIKDLANEATDMLAGSSKGGAGEAINFAGRLRAVSQGWAAAYMLKTWEVPGVDKVLSAHMKKFRKSLDILSKSSETGPQMRKILERMEKTYLFFEVMSESGTFTPTLVAKKTERMLKDASKLTQLYVEQAQKK
jgi:nitrate/nitrite-specific signal transduction histidine kinase